jgi:hypothetical protein
LHQNEFLVAAGRFTSLASMSSAFFVPGTGTFGIGIAPTDRATEYSAGYGLLVGDYSTFGGAVSVIPNIVGGFRFSLGGALHIPTEGEETGAHVGLSIVALPAAPAVNFGGAYWLSPAPNVPHSSART